MDKNDNVILKPILFNTKMVRAILDGKKTVTRRLLKKYVLNDAQWGYTAFTPKGYISCRGNNGKEYGEKFYRLPYQKGDILWVRETWCEENGKYFYKADGDTDKKWHPSLHMPKDAARLYLLVTDIKPERLQDITDEQARAEGCENIDGFKAVWDSTVNPRYWDKYRFAKNPWVWAIYFKEVNIDDYRS